MNVLESLCYHDPRHPDYADLHMEDDDDSIREPRNVWCFCDNCFYGRDELALEIIRLQLLVKEPGAPDKEG